MLLKQAKSPELGRVQVDDKLDYRTIGFGPIPLVR
jgi:hypothetical protein